MARCTALFILFCLARVAIANTPEDDGVLFPDDASAASPIEVELHLPLRDLTRLKPEESESFAAQLVLADGTSLPLEVSPRGKSRRKTCDFPPLWLNFKKKALKGTLFAGQNKLKLVTHCKNSYARRDYLAAEMLVYRLFNLFTDNSFRVRALHITYVEGEERLSHYGFLIEHKKALVRRMGGEVAETQTLPLASIDPEQAGIVNVFAYMMGNTDFSAIMGPGDECCHNVVPVRIGQAAEAVSIFPVPYDFDASGFVNPPYAHPSPAIGIQRVTQRRYRGYCSHNSILPQTIALFVEKKEALFRLIEEFEDIPGLRRDQHVKFIESFYKTIGDQKQVQSKLIKRCR